MNHKVCSCGAEFTVVFEEHSSYEDEEVNYCPVCGEPLPEQKTWFVDDDDNDDDEEDTGFDPDSDLDEDE